MGEASGELSVAEKLGIRLRNRVVKCLDAWARVSREKKGDRLLTFLQDWFIIKSMNSMVSGSGWFVLKSESDMGVLSGAHPIDKEQ